MLLIPLILCLAGVPSYDFARVYDDEGHKLYVYEPEQITGSAVIVLIPGGGFNGHPLTDDAFMAFIRDQGFVVVGIEYQTHEQGAVTPLWPRSFIDCQEAVQYVRTELIPDEGWPDTIIALGASGGAYMAAMLAVAGDVGLLPAADLLGGNRSHRIDGAICISTPVNWEDLLGQDATCFFIDCDDIEMAWEASVLTHVSPGDAPIMIIHGEYDGENGQGFTPWHAEKLALYCEWFGVRHELYILEDGGHAWSAYAQGVPRLEKQKLAWRGDRELGIPGLPELIERMGGE